MKSKATDLIRSFGMSGFMITDELNNLEKALGVDLGHGSRPTAEDPTEYYPQFEKTVRSEAAEMSRHYELFYCLENTVRKLIAETLKESQGANWWESGKVPGKIVQDVTDRVQREIDSGVTRRSDDLIDYTT